MSEQPHRPEDWSPEDQIQFGLSSKGSGPLPEKHGDGHVELPAYLDQALKDALKSPSSKTHEAPPTINPEEQRVHDASDAEASYGSMLDVLRQSTPSPEIAEIEKLRGGERPEGPLLPQHPELAELAGLKFEVEGVMRQQLDLQKRITEHDVELPYWVEQRKNIEGAYTGVLDVYHDYREGRVSAHDLSAAIIDARRTLDGYDLLLSSDLE